MLSGLRTRRLCTRLLPVSEPHSKQATSCSTTLAASILAGLQAAQLMNQIAASSRRQQGEACHTACSPHLCRRDGSRIHRGAFLPAAGVLTKVRWLRGQQPT
jgi:hypothetical protein